MTKAFSVGVGVATVVMTALIAFMFVPMIASADSNAVNFESPTYALGSPNGQDGWSKTGPYDSAIVSNTYGFGTFDAQSLRISNGFADGAFGGQTFSKSLKTIIRSRCKSTVSYTPHLQTQLG